MATSGGKQSTLGKVTKAASTATAVAGVVASVLNNDEVRSVARTAADKGREQVSRLRASRDVSGKLHNQALVARHHAQRLADDPDLAPLGRKWLARIDRIDTNLELASGMSGRKRSRAFAKVKAQLNDLLDDMLSADPDAEASASN